MSPERIIGSLSELPRRPSTIGTMEWNQTGDWRYLTPVVANKVAPCNQSCPAAIPISEYLNYLKIGDFQKAIALLLSRNPLPGLTGRLCYHPCQVKCLRKNIDRPLSIQGIERFLADMDFGIEIKKSSKMNKRVLVIGSGPLGLSCAFYLRTEVAILDPCDQAGGALINLLPNKIEPRLLTNEIRRLTHFADIQLKTGSQIDLNSLGGLLSEADLVIIDPTGLPLDFKTPPDALGFNPFQDETLTGNAIQVQLPHKLRSFKGSMIAHYIQAGRLTAEKAFLWLVTRSSSHPTARSALDLLRQSVIAVNIEIPSLASEVAVKGEIKPDVIWDRERAVQEAQMCLSCGTCNQCMQCVSLCPDASIRLDENSMDIVVDLEHCKGCGICAYECPRGVITMEDTSA